MSARKPPPGDFRKILERLAPHRDTRRVFDAFARLAACALAAQTREAKRFKTEDGYHATLFHELVHSTGHEKRLNRQGIAERNRFGSDPYCQEELVAELGSAFLCGHAGIAERTLDGSAAYIENWLRRLKGDRTLIV